MAWKIISSLLLVLVLLGVALGAGSEPWVAESAGALSYRELGITHGAYLRPVYLPLPGDDYGMGEEVLAFDDLIGKDIDILMGFANWLWVPGDHALDDFNFNQIQNEISDPDRRPAQMITWEPTRNSPGHESFGCTQAYSGVIPPADIINGNCDAYLHIFANDLKARPERILLRFAHEMNISDSPWWPGYFGGDASLYVAMYQHVHDEIMGISDPPTNVEWVWSPNWASNPPEPWNNINNYYPGDAYVDWIGLSGYNWYTSGSPTPQPWRSFEFLYDGVLTDFTCRYAKPQIIAEIGTVEGGGAVPTKAEWISDVYLNSPNYPFLRSIVWFNDYAPNGADFRVTTGSRESTYPNVTQLPASTGAWTNAYSTAIAAPVYNTTLPSLLAATPPHPVCAELYLPLIAR